MELALPTPWTVYLLREGESEGVDVYGDPLPGGVERVPLPVHAVSEPAGTETPGVGVNVRSEVELEVLAPVSTCRQVDDHDRIEWRGTVYSVAGAPAVYDASPWPEVMPTGGVIRLERSAG